MKFTITTPHTDLTDIDILATEVEYCIEMFESVDVMCHAKDVIDVIDKEKLFQSDDLPFKHSWEQATLILSSIPRVGV